MSKPSQNKALRTLVRRDRRPMSQLPVGSPTDDRFRSSLNCGHRTSGPPLPKGANSRPDWAYRSRPLSGASNTMGILTARLSARVVVATVRGDEHGDSRPAIGFDFVVVLCSRLIEACDNQEIGSFYKRSKQAGGPERIGHVQNRLRVQLTQQGLDLGDDIGGAGFVM